MVDQGAAFRLLFAFDEREVFYLLICSQPIVKIFLSQVIQAPSRT